MASPEARVSLPTSAPRGFSLLELLVVMVILGITVATVSTSVFQAESRRLALAADQFSAVLAATSDRAALLNRPHRIRVGPQGFVPEELFRGDWRADLPAPLGERAWGPPTRAAVNAPVTVRIDRTGLVEANRILLVRGEQRLLLTIDGLGRIQRTNPTPPAQAVQIGAPWRAIVAGSTP